MSHLYELCSSGKTFQKNRKTFPCDDEKKVWCDGPENETFHHATFPHFFEKSVIFSKNGIFLWKTCTFYLDSGFEKNVCFNKRKVWVIPVKTSCSSYLYDKNSIWWLTWKFFDPKILHFEQISIWLSESFWARIRSNLVPMNWLWCALFFEHQL